MIQAVALPGRFELRELADPRPGPSEVSVRVAYVGICGSELHVLAAPHDLGADLGSGLVLGHEWSGVVDAVGEAVTRVRPGARVTARPRLPCAGCPRVPACGPTACRAWRRPATGAWADRVVLEEDFLVELPAGTSLRAAALTEPLACALRGVELAAPRPGDHALVLGGGPIGLLAALAARRAGAARVVVAEPAPYRRALAAELGLEVEDPGVPLDPHPACHSQTNTAGSPFAVVYEAVGRAAVVAEALRRVDVGGTVVVLGVAPPDEVVELSPYEVFARQLSLRGAWGIETTFNAAVSLLGPLGVERLATHSLPLARIEEAVALAREARAAKVLLVGDAAAAEETA